MTLWDLQAVSGIPIYGHRYEECVPSDEQLLRRRPSVGGHRQGEMVLPFIYPYILSHYRQTEKASGLPNRSRAIIPVDIWMRSFLQVYQNVQLLRTTHLTWAYTAGSAYQKRPPSHLCLWDILIPGMDEDLFLAGFLATWLCIFVLPVKEGTLRSNALLAASRISRGERISCCPCQDIQTVRGCFRAEAHLSEIRSLVLTWHYIHAWVHLHIRNIRGCLECPSYFSEHGYPLVIQLSRASSTLERERVRLFFFAGDRSIQFCPPSRDCWIASLFGGCRGD